MRCTAIPGFIALSFASSAFILGCLSVPWCDFATLAATVVDSGGTILLETDLGFGLWRHQTYSLRDGGLYIENSCSGYDESLVEINGSWKAARAFGIMALVLGGLNLMYSYWIVCPCSGRNNLSQSTARISGAIFIVASFYQGFTLFFLRSSICKSAGEAEFQQQLELSLQPAEIIYDESCTLSMGATMGIASTICWFVACICLCVYNPQKEDDATRHDVNENEQIVPDGAIDSEEAEEEKPVDTSGETDIIVFEDEQCF